jgi:hypothetical protein
VPFGRCIAVWVDGDRCVCGGLSDLVSKATSLMSARLTVMLFAIALTFALAIGGVVVLGLLLSLIV